MSDVTNDEIREILEGIRARTGSSEIDGDAIREWSREDVDRLLEITRRGEGREDASVDGGDISADEGSIYTAEESYDYEKPEPAEDEPAETADESEKAEETEEPVKDKKIDASAAAKKIKGGFGSFAAKIKEASKKLAESFRTTAEQDEEERYLLDDEDDEYEDEAEIAEESADEDDDDGDMKIADFSAKDDSSDSEPQTAEEKTILIEKPGIVMKKSSESGEDDLEGAPVIISADDALADDESSKIPTIAKMENDIQNKLRAAAESGQTVMEGFGESAEETPGKIEESEAEKELFEKRKKKISEFVLFGESGDPYGSEEDADKIGELFETHEERPRRKEEEHFEGVEYDELKDARRVQRYLNSQVKKSRQKTAGLCALFVLALLTGIASSAKTTVAGDRILTIFFTLVISAAAILVSGQRILESIDLLKKKKFNINTVISFSAIVCFAQTLLMLILYFFDRNSVSVFGGAGVGLLLLSEINTYIMNCRTADAMELCTGDNKDKLYSIESISDDKDILELGRNVESKSPRIRYSCKTRFPSHLVEMCMSETAADKRTRLIMIILAAAGVINFIASIVVSHSFSIGFAAFAVTLAMCVPAYGALLTQLPMRWVNKKINRTGALITCQDAVNELYRTNAIVVDSRDLFDQGACSMLGFKDFKNVRVDDAMLYAAAMVIRSGGPLTGVFDQMVVNRRDILPTVKSFGYEEKLGVSGWIYNQKVILGNRTLMENHNVDIPAGIDEDKYLVRGDDVIYLAIANKLAAMMVVRYAPNKKLGPYLKKLRDSGVSILVRNCDPNVTERMISACYDMRLDNIKIINTSAGRVFKKYKSRPKVSTRAVSIHDGSAYTFVKSLSTAAMLHHTFKITDILTAIGVIMGFAIVLVLSVLNVVADLPAIFVILLQMLIAGAFIGVTKITCGK